MKKILFTLAIAATVASCTPKKSETKSPKTIKPIIAFQVSDGSNLSSFNIYRNDDIVLQLPASDAKNIDYDFDDEEMLLEGLDSLKYTIEPVFMDSSNADIDIRLTVIVNDSVKATQSYPNVKYNKTATISYSVK